jgi:hypothetical protein
MDVGSAREKTYAEQVPGSRRTRVWIPLGAGLFIAALAGSAVAVPKLSALHAFQSLIYVATIILARKNRAEGFGAGVTLLWMYSKFCITVFPYYNSWSRLWL